LLLVATLSFPLLAGSFLIRDVRVFDGEKASEHRSVLVEDGKIVKIGGANLRVAGATVIDGRGRTLLPGLFDSHVHVGEDTRGALRQALLLGVTTQLDMFNGGERLKRMKQIESEDPPDLAGLRTAGIGATAPGGHPTQMGGPPIPTIKGPEEAQAFVDARIAEGSDYLKIIYDDLASVPQYKVPMISRATLEALVAAAHLRHKLAVVHISTEAQARDAIAAGADGLAHLFAGDKVSSDFGHFAASHHVFVIPTLETLYTICKEGDGSELLADPHLKPYIATQWQAMLRAAWPVAQASCVAARQSIRELRDAHVPILAGTDAPIPGTTYGASVHGELAFLVAAGLSPVQALASATSIPARTFGLADRGRVQRGMRADLLLVEGDPTTDIRSTRNIVAVWKRGIPVDRVVPEAHGTGAQQGR
jgi:imidazolonepropionase-like amidohydrolase